MAGTTYDDIGRSYRRTRVPDRRIAAQLHAALGDAGSVVNVGAGPLRDCVPEARAFDDGRAVGIARLVALLGGPARVRVEPVLVPHPCTDGFAAAYWRRPEAYLDPVVRAGMSVLAQPGEAVVAPGIARLRADLASGAWHERHAALLGRSVLDAGYRLVVAEL